MRKLLLTVGLSMLLSIPVFASGIQDNYCENALGAIVFDYKDVRDLLEITDAGESKSAEAFRTIKSTLREKFELDIDNDLRNVGCFVVPDVQGLGFVGFATGKYNSETKVQLLCEAFKSALKKELKTEKVPFAGSSLNSLTTDGFRIVFKDAETLFFGSEETIQKVLKGEIKFGKAPEYIEEIFANSSSFIQLSGNLLALLSSVPNMPAEVARLASNCKSFHAYKKGESIVIGLNYSEKSMAENSESALVKFKSDVIQQSKNICNQAKEELKNVTVKDFFVKANTYYVASKQIDNLEAFSITRENSTLMISLPYNPVMMTAGGIGVITAMAIPNFVKARESSREKACFSNQRVLLGAVEMYNLDNPVMMETLDVDQLIKKRYLFKAPVLPTPECAYRSEGDLTKDGKIVCPKHGAYVDR